MKLGLISRATLVLLCLFLIICCGIGVMMFIREFNSMAKEVLGINDWF